MKTRTFFASSLVLLGLAFASAFAAGDGGAPKLVIAKPHHEFGIVFEGDPVKHDFILHNRGGADLQIEKVKTG